AYRRPLTDSERDELRALYRKLREQEIPHEEAFRLTLARVFVAPAFLYRLEKPGPGKRPGPVSDWELASRLSFCLWSSQPDEELRAVAAAGKLHEPETLAAQSRRMLKDARVRRLATEFSCQWLLIHDFDQLDEKSERHFPTFNKLRAAMYEEAIRFFTGMFQADAPVLDVFKADYIYVNADLARHYEIPEAEFRRGVRDESAPSALGEWRRVDGAGR